MDNLQGPYYIAHGTLRTLLYSTWHSAQRYEVSWAGGEFAGGQGAWTMDTCIHMAESLSCSPETSTVVATHSGKQTPSEGQCR